MSPFLVKHSIPWFCVLRIRHYDQMNNYLDLANVFPWLGKCHYCDSNEILPRFCKCNHYDSNREFKPWFYKCHHFYLKQNVTLILQMPPLRFKQRISLILQMPPLLFEQNVTLILQMPPRFKQPRRRLLIDIWNWTEQLSFINTYRHLR